MKQHAFISRNKAGRSLFGAAHNAMKTVISFCLVSCASLSAYAQYSIYQGTNMDRIYPVVATVYKADPSYQGEGYVISSTAALNGTTPMATEGEIIRTNPAGTPIWTMRYNAGGHEHRFTHIETYNFHGTLNYLVVGSVKDAGGNDNILIACVDDNGNVTQSTQLRGTMFPNAIATEGIATSDGHFAITGFECDGFDNTDNRVVFALKIDSTLNVVRYHVYNTPNNTYDYDMATGIIEGASADEYYLVGTANKDIDPLFGITYACSMSSLIDMNTGFVTWSYNHSTAGGYHWDCGADGYFDPSDSSFWLLANSSVVHSFNLTQLDYNGSLITYMQYVDSNYGPDLDNYGFELKRSLQNSARFVVGGWKISWPYVEPSIHEIDPATTNVIWKNRYTSSNNGMATFNENNWLRVRAGGQFPYYYNNVMTYKSDRRGYAILGDDSLNSSNVETPMLWRSINRGGTVFCGNDIPPTIYISWSRDVNAPLDYIGSPMPAGSLSMNPMPINYQEKKCSADGSAMTAPGSNSKGKSLLSPVQTRVYPNPASDSWTFESLDGISTVTVYDAFGREALRLQANGSNKQSVSVSSLSTGIYIVKIETGKHEIHSHTVQVMR